MGMFEPSLLVVRFAPELLGDVQDPLGRGKGQGLGLRNGIAGLVGQIAKYYPWKLPPVGRTGLTLSIGQGRSIQWQAEQNPVPNPHFLPQLPRNFDHFVDN